MARTRSNRIFLGFHLMMEGSGSSGTTHVADYAPRFRCRNATDRSGTYHDGEPMTELPLDQQVAGRNLVPGTLGDQLSPSPVVLVFLRHFG
ncbi:MAG: hypothetical protein CMJ90_01905 [Planctomycetes bacterium]|nr:hypothetical protein [Planctomycetota bacterium]